MRKPLICLAFGLLVVGCGPSAPTRQPACASKPVKTVEVEDTLAKRKADCEEIFNRGVLLLLSHNVEYDRDDYTESEMAEIKVKFKALVREEAGATFFSQCLGEMSPAQVTCALVAPTVDVIESCMRGGTKL